MLARSLVLIVAGRAAAFSTVPTDLCTAEIDWENEADAGCDRFFAAGASCDSIWSDFCVEDNPAGADDQPLSSSGCSQCHGNYTTCVSAYNLITDLETKCPRDCEDCDEEEDCDNPCADDQPEHTAATCGTDECGDYLASVTDEDLSTAVEIGFPSCVNNTVLSGAAAYGNLYHLNQYYARTAGQCELSDRLALSTVGNKTSRRQLDEQLPPASRAAKAAIHQARLPGLQARLREIADKLLNKNWATL